MAYENDPNRMIDPDRPTRRFQYRTEDGFGWLPMILAVAAVVLLIMLLLPSRNDTGSRVTQNTPEQTTPTTPPANKPAPTTPAPTTPAPGPQK